MHIQLETCEAEGCNNVFVAGYGYSCMPAWAVTGHARLPGFVCSEARGGQHWGCSPSHAKSAMMKCLSEHMSESKLLELHKLTEGPRYSPEDEKWASSRGEAFHIVKDKDDLHSIIDAMLEWK